MLLKKGMCLLLLAASLLVTTPAFATAVTTGGITDVQPTSATLTGTIGTAYQGAPIVRFHISPVPDFSSNEVISNNLFQAGEVFYELPQAGFSTQTRYYYKLVVTDASETYEGEVRSFWTLATKGIRVIDGIASFASDFNQIQLTADTDLNLPAPNESYVAFATPFGDEFDIQNAISPADQGYIVGVIDEDIGSISVTFSGLVEGARYDIRLGTARWNGSNSETFNYDIQISTSRYTLAPEATGSVADIIATSSTSSITLDWDASELDDWVGLRVILGMHTPPGNGGGPIFGTSFFVAAHAVQTVTFSTLPPATAYDLTFYALNQVDGQSHTSSYVEVGAITGVSTLSLPPSGPASNLALGGDALSADQLSLEWTAVASNVFGYLVLNNEGGSPADLSAIRNGQPPPPGTEFVDSPAVVLSGLNAGTQYSVTVVPFNQVNGNHANAHYRTADAVSASFYTLAARPAPIAALTPVNSGAESIDLIWELPDHAAGALLYYTAGSATLAPVPVDQGVAPPEADLSGPIKVVNLGAVDSHEVTGLAPFTDYSFAIVPYNYASNGDAIAATYHYNFDDPATLVTSTQTAVLTVVADPGQQKLHGEADPTLTYTATGFVGADDETILAGSLAREAGEAPGSYPITLGDLDAGVTYSIEFTGADFTIRPNYGPDPDNRLHVDRAVIGGDQSGSSWANAIPELGDALKWAAQNEADWNGGGALKIYVTAGVYTPLYSATPETFGVDLGRGNSFPLLNNVEVYGGFAPALGMADMSSRDPNVALTVLSGDIDDNDDVNEDGIVTHSDQINGENSFRVVTAYNVGNSAVLDGFFITGGLANADVALFPSFTQGAGMHLHSAEPILANLVFTGNRALNHGGGLYVRDGFPILTDSRFDGNSAKSGGGMYNVTEDGASAPVLTNVSFSHNSADEAGGGMYNGGFVGTSNPVLTNVTFNANSAIEVGGAFSNRAVSGVANPILTNVIFSENSVVHFGGALYNGGGGFGAVVSPELTNVTFRGNSAAFGGGIYSHAPGNVTSEMTIQNSVFWDNPGGSIFNGDSTPLIRFSLMEGCNSGESWNTGCGTDGGGNLPDADPLFANGAAGDLRLLPGSSAVFAGNPVLASGVVTDLSSNPRLVDGLIDLGAYQSPGFVLSVSPVDQTAVLGTDYLPIELSLSARDDTGFEDPKNWPLEGGAIFASYPETGATVAFDGVTDNPLVLMLNDSGEAVTPASTATGERGTFQIAFSSSGAGPIHAQMTNIEIHAVTAFAGDNGTVTPTEQIVEHGSAATVTIEPDPHYAAVVGGSCPAGTLTGQNYVTGPIVEACSVTVEFVSGELVAVPDEVHFLDIVITRMRTLEFNLVNAAAPGAPPVKLSGIMLESGGPAFTMDGVTCKTGSVLSPGQNCRLQVSFQPMNVTPHEGAIRVTTVAGQTVIIPLFGTVLPDKAYRDRFEAPIQ